VGKIADFEEQIKTFKQERGSTLRNWRTLDIVQGMDIDAKGHS
jgi:hypothetical protein